jgi:ribosome maturation factor RimP
MKSISCIALLSLVQYSSSWTAPLTNQPLSFSNSYRRGTRNLINLNESGDDGASDDTIPIDHSLPRDEAVWKAEGERIIRTAAMEAAANLEEKDIDIAWKPGKIVITVANAICKASSLDEDEDVEIEYDDDIGDIDLEGEESDAADEDEGEGEADIVAISRAINYALGEEGEDSLGYSIAVNHSLEVTTPGATDELEGIMFEAYKGFNVIVETVDPKKAGKVKIIEASLIERTDDFLILNAKGRRRKLKNQNVISVKLPKAKREKGVK